MKEEFNVSLKTLFEKQLGFEAYFILWCLYNKQKEQLIDYVAQCRKIPTEEFYKLKDKKLITIGETNASLNSPNVGVITYEHLKLTKLGLEVFELQNFDVLFNEFRNAYPSVVGDRFTRRRLHTDLKRCKNLYKKIINDDIELHNKMCKCAMLYHEEKRRSGSEMYMQNLVTWLHQENYLPYMEEAGKVDSIKKGGNSSLDDI